MTEKAPSGGEGVLWNERVAAWVSGVRAVETVTAARMMMFLLSKAPPLQGRGWGGGGIHLAQDSRAHPVATIEQARKSHCPSPEGEGRILSDEELADPFGDQRRLDRKSTRLNSSH